MVTTFFDIFLGFMAAAVLGGIVITSTVLVMGHGFGTAMLIVLAWVILCFFIFGRLARMRLSKLGNLLNECEVQNYVDKYDKIESRALGANGRRMLMMNKARGLISLGAVDEAIDLLDNIVVSEKHQLREMHLLALLNSTLFSAYIEKGDIEKAESALAVCRYMINDPIYKEPYLGNMKELCRRAEMRLALAKGEFDGLEEEYWEVLRSSYTRIDKVMNHYRLAEIAEHFGNEEDRQEHLEYVSDNGGTSIYRWLADRALNGKKVADQAIYHGPGGHDD